MRGCIRPRKRKPSLTQRLAEHFGRVTFALNAVVATEPDASLTHEQEAERDAARAWSARWKAVSKRLWAGIHKSLDQSERLAARMLKAEAERDDALARLVASWQRARIAADELVRERGDEE